MKETDDKVAYTASPHPMMQHEPDDATQKSMNMLANQAISELAVSFGFEPWAGYEWPRPAWMAEFRWDPPLPEERSTGRSAPE